MKKKKKKRGCSPRKRSFKEKYAKVVMSGWFKRAYDGKSVGEMKEVEY